MTALNDNIKLTLATGAANGEAKPTWDTYGEAKPAYAGATATPGLLTRMSALRTLEKGVSTDFVYVDTCKKKQ